MTGPVAVGDALPPFTVAVTLQRLVMEAAANRDFAPLHFDGQFARETGAPHAYANTTFIETLIEAAIRNWAGPAARIKMVELTMKSFNAVGDDVSATGVVIATRADAGESTVELEMWVESAHGRTVEGRAVVVMPLPAS
jgi:acyl dehydratase